MNIYITSQIKIAINKFKGGETNEAISLIKNLLKIYPDIFEILHTLGVMLASNNKHSDALIYFQKALKKNPNNNFVNFNIAIALRELKRPEESIKYHLNAIKLCSNHAEAWLEYGKTLEVLKDLNKAIIQYDKAIEIKPELTQAWLNKGILLYNLKKYDEALIHYDKAIKLNPEYAEIWLNKGLALSQLQFFSEAIIHFDKAIQIKPELTQAWLNKGITLYNLKKYDESLIHYDKAIELNPDYAEAWHNKGSALNQLKLYSDAINNYDKAIQIKPNFPQAWLNKGIILYNLKRYDEALIHYEKAIDLYPEYAEAWLNKGAALNQLKFYDEALTHLDKAIQIKPDLAQAWFFKGSVFNSLNNINSAIECYKLSINFDCNYINSIFNLGIIYSSLNYYDSAISCFDRVIEIDSNHAESWYNKATVLRNLNKNNQAIECFEKAFKINKEMNYVFGEILHTKMKICDWSSFEESISICEDLIRKSHPVIQPFALLSLVDNPDLHIKCSKIFINNNFQQFDKEIHRHIINGNKIRVGYFSSDFRNHPISHLMVELFELHDKNNFEIFGISYGLLDDSPILERIKFAFNQFIDVREKSDSEIINLSKNLKLDIAVDLGGFTSKNRFQLFCTRLAPIQISYLGYLGTTSSNCIDYIIADKTLIPNNLKEYYSENIIYLPSYQVNDTKGRKFNHKISKSDLGISDDTFVFCCFNNNYKITPKIFSAWMEIIKSTNNSVLLIYSDNDLSKFNLLKEAHNHGVSNNKIIFCKHVEYESYLARYNVCDIFLDTFPYNAGTTGSDALWCGTPILTLKGQSLASRMAASLLNSVGLEDFIAESLTDYINKAKFFAENKNALIDAKATLRRNIKTSLLFDSENFRVSLEKAYNIVYSNSLKNLKCDDIYIG